MSNMKRWLREQGIPYPVIASQLHLSRGAICQKVNGKIGWRRNDILTLHDLYGLSADFIQDLVPYEQGLIPVEGEC